MQHFAISALDTSLADTLQHTIDTKTKPLGALGDLEDLAKQIGLIQHTVNPKLTKPAIVVFAGDHGISNEPVSAYPRDVTWQMVHNFLSGGGAINVFARQHGIQVQVVNAGVDHVFEDTPSLINIPIAAGTKNSLHEPAMSIEECNQAIEAGAKVVDGLHAKGTNVIGFGEMGIGNTSAASLILSSLGDLPLEECVGRGTGVDDTQFARKAATLQAAKDHHGKLTDPAKVLRTFGGFEIAMMVGAYLQAAQLGMVIIVDGFIASAALLVATRIEPTVLEYCIFSHTSDEFGHAVLLKQLHASPLLRLHLRLGEGSGIALAYPLLESAVQFLNDMASFESAAVSDKTTPKSVA